MMKKLVALATATVMALSTFGSSASAASSQTIYAVSNSHLDTVWSWTLEQTVGQFLPKTFSDNFALIEKYPDYQFNFEGAYRYQLLKEYYPDLYEELKGYINSGNWNVAGSALENGDVNVPSPEALFRNFLYGNNYFEDSFGVRSDDVFLPDCFGFSYTLPSIAAHSNIAGFSTQKLSWGNTFPGEKLPFDMGMWKGPDGKSVIAKIDYNSYTSGFDSGIRNNSGLLTKLNNSGIGLVTALFGSVGDRGGPPSESTIAALSREIAGNTDSNVNVKFASTDYVFKTLTEAQKAKLPSYDGELLLKVHGSGGYTSRAISKRWNRKGELLGDAAERANVASQWLGNTTYDTDKFEQIWTTVIAHQFHDDIPGTSNSTVYKRTWNEYMTSIKQFATEYQYGVEGVVSSMNTIVDSGVPVVVNNPVASDRTEAVEATVTISTTLPYLRVFDDKGNEVASQFEKLGNGQYKVIFTASVPSLGYRTYKVAPSNQACAVKTGLSVKANQLSNDKYTVTINSNGDINSIYDKTMEKELLSSPIRLSLFDLSGVYWAAWELAMNDYATKLGSSNVAGTPNITIVEKGPAKVALQIERQYGKSTYTQIVSLAENGEVVKVDNVVDWNETAKLLKAEFNLAASNPTATYDLGLGVIERQNNTQDKSEVPLQKWADVTNADTSFGVSIINDCKYGMDKYDDDTIRLSLIHTPKDNYSHDTGLFGSSGQNVQDIGENRFAYGIYGHSGKFSDSNIQLEAEAFNQPMNVFQAEQHAGTLGSTYSFGSVDNDKVLVRAIKKAERSNEIVVRFNEGSGSGQSNVNFTLGNGIQSAREIYATEEEIASATVKDGKLVFDIGAYEVKSFALTLKSSTNTPISKTSAYVNLPYNMDVFSSNSKKSDGGMNYIGDCYPSELVPSVITSGGVSYKTGSTADGQKNAVASDGQTISLPNGTKTLNILAVSKNGDKKATFKAGNKTVTLNIADYSENIAQWDLDDLNIKGYVKEQTPAFIATHRHTAGKDNIAATTYMFSYSIDVSGAGTLTLPKDSDILLFAATAVNNGSNALISASELYDSRDRNDVPIISDSIVTGFEDADETVTTNLSTNNRNTSNLKCELSSELSKNGTKSLKISGTDNSTDTSYAYFTLSTKKITVTPGTVLSYDFYAGNDLGKYTAIDLEFSSGSPLRDRKDAKDTNGIQMHPSMGHGKTGEWITVVCDLYAIAPGADITKIMLAYDHSGDTGNFSAYVDNLSITSSYDYSSLLLNQAESLDKTSYTADSMQTVEDAVTLLKTVLAATDAAKIESDFAKTNLLNAMATLVKIKNPYQNYFARDFDTQSGGISIDKVNGVPANIGGVSSGSWTLYHAFSFGNRGSDSISIRYSGWNTGTNTVAEIHLGNASGELIGTVSVPQTSTMSGAADWSVYTTATAKLDRVLTGEQDICVVFKNASGGHVCNVDYFVFTSAEPKAALTQLCEDASSIDRTGLNAAKLAELDKALAAANQLIKSSTASESDIENAFVALQTAINALQTPDPVILGDIDNDTLVTVSDVVALRSLIMKGSYTENQLSAGDFDHDNKLTVSDVVALRSYIMKGTPK